MQSVAHTRSNVCLGDTRSKLWSVCLLRVCAPPVCTGIYVSVLQLCLPLPELHYSAASLLLPPASWWVTQVCPSERPSSNEAPLGWVCSTLYSVCPLDSTLPRTGTERYRTGKPASDFFKRLFKFDLLIYLFWCPSVKITIGPFQLLVFCQLVLLFVCYHQNKALV